MQQLRQRLEQQNVSAAVGAVWVPHTEDAEELMRQADDRMYRAKELMKQA